MGEHSLGDAVHKLGQQDRVTISWRQSYPELSKEWELVTYQLVRRVPMGDICSGYFFCREVLYAPSSL